MRRAEGVKRLLNSRRSALRKGQRRLLSDQGVKGPGSTSFQLNLRVSSLLEVDPTGFGGCVAFSISRPCNHQRLGLADAAAANPFRLPRNHRKKDSDHLGEA